MLITPKEKLSHLHLHLVNLPVDSCSYSSVTNHSWHSTHSTLPIRSSSPRVYAVCCFGLIHPNCLYFLHLDCCASLPLKMVIKLKWNKWGSIFFMLRKNIKQIQTKGFRDFSAFAQASSSLFSSIHVISVHFNSNKSGFVVLYFVR